MAGDRPFAYPLGFWGLGLEQSLEVVVVLIPIRDDTIRLKTTTITAVAVSVICLAICRGESPKTQKIISAFVGLSATIIGTPPMFTLWQTRAARIVEREGLQKWQALTTGQKWGQIIEGDLRKMGASQSQLNPCGDGGNCGCPEPTMSQPTPRDDWGGDVRADGGVQLYDMADLVDEAVGVIVAGQSGSGKTCVSSWLLGLFTQDEPAIIRVCDPHYNDIWEDLGLTAIGEFDEIQSEFEWLIQELDRRRLRKKNKQPLGDNLIVVADEVGACIESFENPEVVQKALKRIGSEGRKFGIILIAIDQSPNSADLGISAKKRDNYLMIGLCSVAIALAKQDLKSNDPTLQFLSAQAYPCVIKMGGILTPAIHPTHGHHMKFKKKGNAPRNLLPINQIEQQQRNTEPTTDTTQQQRLERMYSLPCADTATDTQPQKHALQACPHCGATDTKKNGYYKGMQRHQCKSCGGTWTEG